MNRRLLFVLVVQVTLGLLVGATLKAKAQAGLPSEEHSASVQFITNFRDEETKGGTRDRWGDSAFWGTTMVVFDGQLGLDSGFRVFDISNPAEPRLLSRVDRVGGTAHIAIWEHLVFLSIDGDGDEPCVDAGDTNCGPVFSGLVVYSIADREHPQKLAALSVPCSGHTFTLLPDLKQKRLLLYFTHGGCPDDQDGIALIEVALKDPSHPSLLKRLPIQPLTGNHDMTIFMPLKLAVVLDVGIGFVLWDLSDPEHPQKVGVVLTATTPTASGNNNHSAAFSWDGRYLVIGEETGGAGAAPATPDPIVGRLRFYDVEQIKQDYRLYGDTNAVTQPLATFKIPAERGDALSPFLPHQFNVLPLKSKQGVQRHILSIGWFRGGLSVVDFSDPSHPEEIGYYVFKNGVGADGIQGIHSASYSAFWYNGYIYAANGTEDLITDLRPSRGLDIFTLNRDDPAVAPWIDQVVQLGHLNYATQEGVAGLRVTAIASSSEQGGDTLTATISNDSFSVAPPTRTAFLLDGVLLREAETPAILPGESVTLVMPWTPPTDTAEHTLTVTPDSSGTLSTIETSSQSGSLSVPVHGADIVAPDSGSR